MIVDQTCTYYSKTSTKNAKGQVTNAFGSGVKFQANIQPIALNTATLAGWGAQDLSANSRIMFTYKADCQMLDRVKDAFGGYYEIRGVNPWGSPPFSHYECLLIPVQGEVTP